MIYLNIIFLEKSFLGIIITCKINYSAILVVKMGKYKIIIQILSHLLIR
jgi:hypothetical protein